MPTEPPPPRWRVVERGRRLEVIDTWATGRPATMAPPAPATSNRNVGSPPRAPAPSSIGAEAPSPWGKPADGGPAFRFVVSLATLGATDANSRPLLTTAAWYDRKAPRTLALGDAGVARLGRVLLALGGAWVGSFGLLGWFALGVPLVAWAIVSQQGKGWTTRWVDGLEGR